MTSVVDQIALAQANYNDLPAVPFAETTELTDLYMATPDRLGYALGWIMANQIIQERFLSTAIDALPVLHPANGWDRFLITRRVSSHLYSQLPADELGRLMLAGDNAPRFLKSSEQIHVAYRDLLLTDPDAAIADLLGRIPTNPGGVGGLKKMRRSEQAPKYPAIIAAVTDLLLEYPGLVPSREIYVDDQPIDGIYHPLHPRSAAGPSQGSEAHKEVNGPVITYNWIQLQYGDRFAFVDRRGSRAVYRTDRESWARPRKLLEDASNDAIKERIAGWLRIGGAEPDPTVD